jgi:4-amino-4-deoxy-L-arabinose transferase-like glycosyltransferase
MTAAWQAWQGASFGRRLFLIWLVGLLLRLVYVLVFSVDEDLSGDALGYHHAANLLADGQGFIEPFRHFFGNVEEVVINGEPTVITTPLGHAEPTAGHPPVWTTVLGVVSFVGFTTPLQHRIATALIGSLTVLVFGQLGRELRSERLGLISAAVGAGYAFIWINDALVMSETIAIMAAALASLFGLRFTRAPTLANAVTFGLVGALAALTRAELILFLPIVALVALLRADLSWRDRAVRYGVAGLVAVAVIAPWVGRNLVVFENPVLLSNGTGTVLIQANCDDTYYGDNIGYWSLPCGGGQPYGPNGELLDESERDEVVREIGSDYISDHKTRLATVVIPARIGRMWGVYEPIEQLRLDAGEQRPFGVSLVGLAQLAVLGPLAIAGAVIMWRRKEPLLCVALWAPLATFTAAIAFGSTRYRSPAEVTIVILGAVAIDTIVAARSSGPAPAPDSQAPAVGRS